MNAHQAAELLFRQDCVQDFLSERWTLEEYLYGLESLWFCQSTHFVFSYARKGSLDAEGGCLVVILVTDPAIHTAYLLDFDVAEKVEEPKRDSMERAKTRIFGGDKKPEQTKRLVMGDYLRCMAFDLKTGKHADLTGESSHFDHLRLWHLVQQFSRGRLQEPAAKQTFSSVLRKAIHSVRS